MKHKSHPWLYHSVSLLLGFALLSVLVYFAGYEQFLAVIFKASIPWIIIAIIIYACSWIFRVWRLEKFTHQAGIPIKVSELFKLHISGYALNVLLPAKLGDAATVGYLRLQGIKVGRSAAIIFQTRILDLLALIALSIPAFIIPYEKGVPGSIAAAVAVCILIVLIPFMTVFLDKQHSLARLLEKLERKFFNRFLKLASNKLKDAYEGYHTVVSDRKLTLVTILLSVIIWILEGLTCYVIAIAVKAEIALLPALLAISVSNIGKIIPTTPGSVGVYEGLMTAVLVFFGVQFDIALAVAILDDGIKKVFNVVVGLQATTRMGARISEITRQSRNESMVLKT